jgi:hypothetical protein
MCRGLISSDSEAVVTSTKCLSFVVQSEERKKAPPRGSLHLWGAVIAPSDEDSQTFTVNGANGEVRGHE